MQLNEIQKRFRDTMLDHPRVLDNPDPAFAAQFKTGDIPLPARLKVYRNNIVGSLTGVMTATFPLVDKLVGREFMEKMARSFILENPPRQGCLSLYGKGFDSFIAGFEPAKSLPYLPDVARLEIAMNEAYYARDDKPLTAARLAVIKPEDVPETALKLRDAARLVSSAYPLLAIKQFCEADGQEGTIDISRGGIRLLVDRPELEVRITPVDEDEYTILEYIGQNMALGEALEKTMETFPAFDFQKFLQKHIALQSLADF